MRQNTSQNVRRHTFRYDGAARVVEEELLHAMAFLSRENASPYDARDKVEQALAPIGLHTAQLTQMSEKDIREQFGSFSPLMATALGIVGKSYQMERKHIIALRFLEVASHVNSGDKKILFAISNAYHSISRDQLRRWMEAERGAPVAMSEVIAERMRQIGTALWATDQLLGVLSVSKGTLSTERCQYPHEGVWAISNMAHYCFAHAEEQELGGVALGGEILSKINSTPSDGYRKSLWYQRGLLNNFHFPDDEYKFRAFIPELASHHHTKDAALETICGLLCLRARTLSKLRQIDRAMLTAAAALQVSPSSDYATRIFKETRQQHKLSQNQIQALLACERAPLAAAETWETVSQQGSIPRFGDPQAYLEAVGRIFHFRPETKPLFVQFYRTEALIAEAWERAATSDGYVQVLAVYDLLKSIAKDSALVHVGLDETITRYREIIETMEP